MNNAHCLVSHLRMYIIDLKNACPVSIIETKWVFSDPLTFNKAVQFNISIGVWAIEHVRYGKLTVVLLKYYKMHSDNHVHYVVW